MSSKLASYFFLFLTNSFWSFLVHSRFDGVDLTSSYVSLSFVRYFLEDADIFFLKGLMDLLDSVSTSSRNGFKSFAFTLVDLVYFR